ncbi:MAG: flavodoxin [Peptoniphilaceae bacterium]|nr:flavodoxin [Peptoniphilaceae bacterium]MDY6018692.1 flavodoxin [Anaerococcus sp.]
MNVNIIYWSGTGNTKTMAEKIAEGVKEAGGEPNLIFVSEASIDDVKNVDNIAFGCPAMGQEELEEDEMRPFMDQANQYLSGKKVLLFGSYEWAEGEWMEKWVEEVKQTGANLISDGLIAYDNPDDKALIECQKMGNLLCK